jgi:tryptophanyl-tRNA synthetase
MNLAKSLRRAASCNICLGHHRQYAIDVNPPIRLTPTGGPRIVFSGIQPTGVPHLGNYLGALRPWVELQHNSHWQDRNNFCVVDLHAVTIRQDAETLLRWRKESFASLLAVGLDPKKSTIFYQSDVPSHSELMWLLSTVASTGYLSRMTQWKSKLNLSENASMEDESSREVLKLGLFSYPVLQAADILLYNATHVPIGEDQVQHLEFTRSLANSFNKLYGDGSVLKLPQAIVSPAKRVMSLRNPAKKMSKSDPDENSRILIIDTPEEIQAKMKTAVTDSEDGISYDVKKRPGISNLIDILSHTSQIVSKGSAQTVEESTEIAKQHKDLSKKAFKEMVADSVIASLDGIRERYQTILSSPHEIRDAAMLGRRKARQVGGAKILEVYRAMGIETTRPERKTTQRVD